MKLGTSFDRSTSVPGASLADMTGYACPSADVLAIDIENVGSSAVTGFSVLGRISSKAPFRDITPVSFTVQSYDVLDESPVSPSTLAAGAFAKFALNVSTYESVRLQASGVGAVLVIHAATYEE